jgi:hypothetical protein
MYPQIEPEEQAYVIQQVSSFLSAERMNGQISLRIPA